MVQKEKSMNARERGKQANLAGRQREDNPYARSAEYWNWDYGWLELELDIIKEMAYAYQTDNHSQR